MHDTISYTALLLTLLTGAVVAAMVYFIIVLVRLNRVAAQLEGVLGKADELLVSLQTLAAESTETVIAARQFIDQGTSVAADIAVLSARCRGFGEGGAGQALTLFDRIKSTVALVAGVKAAYATLKHFVQSRRQTAAETIRN